MDNISITKQYNELDEYSQIKDYINKVLDNFNDLDKLDSNDIYEITYVKKLCESKLAQGIENDGTREAFEDTLARISLITDLLSDSMIKKAMSNTLNKDKVTKVNSSRHAKSNKMPDLPDKSNPKFANPIHEYTKRIASKLVMQAILFICILNANDVSRIVIDAMSKLFNGTEQVTSNPTDAFTQVTGMIDTIMHLLIILMFFVLCVSMMLDIMYITFPWFRCMVDDRKSNEIDNNSGFVSEYAIDAVKSADTVVGYHKFSNNDKMKESMVLLDNMISALSNFDITKARFSSSDKHKDNLISIKNRIKDSKTDYDKVKNLVDVEIYYINNKEYFDTLLDRYNKTV